VLHDQVIFCLFLLIVLYGHAKNVLSTDFIFFLHVKIIEQKRIDVLSTLDSKASKSASCCIFSAVSFGGHPLSWRPRDDQLLPADEAVAVATHQPQHKHTDKVRLIKRRKKM
jgi:hypothetical protein